MPTQDLLSAITLVPVPDYWPPLAADQQDQADHADHPDPPGALNPGRGETAAEPGPPWPRQFAVLLAEALAGVRPVRQVLPWMSEQGNAQLRRLLPLFAGDHRPRVLRVLTAQPAKHVIEMTMVVAFGPRTRALAVRLEQAPHAQSPRWRCTAIEAA